MGLFERWAVAKMALAIVVMLWRGYPAKSMTKFLLVVIPAFLAVAIAILSVQNATPVSIQFLAFRSVPLPFGLWLGGGLAAGMVGAASLLTFLPVKRR